MIRYITRHGQVISPGSHHLYPKGDVPLSELGREQARMLGERLAKEKFCGYIISSPFLRTMETSEIIAQLTDSVIYPFAPIHEVIFTDNFAAEFAGTPLEELKRLFPHTAADAVLEPQWWPDKAETHEDVVERVRKGVVQIESKFAHIPVLYVGHGASSSALLHIYEIPSKKNTTLFNCSLSSTDLGEHTVKPVFCDTLHIPYEKTTSNHRMREEFDDERFNTPYEGEILFPDEFKTLEGPKILHIGDTNSSYYTYYAKLIKTVKPDVIIHTGDMADEVKVGNHRDILKYEYVKKTGVMLDIMKSSGARMIIIPGNNDLPDEIRKLAPEAEIYEENTVIDIFGVECRAGHYVDRMTFDKKLTFYGHSVARDRWKYSFNAEGYPCRFNSLWGSFVYYLGSDKFYRFKRYE